MKKRTPEMMKINPSWKRFISFHSIELLSVNYDANQGWIKPF